MAKDKKLKKRSKRPERPAEVAADELAPRRRRKSTQVKPIRTTPVKPGRRRLNPDVTDRLKGALGEEAALLERLTDQAAAARARRDNLIIKLADRGLSEREIGTLAKMTGPRVNQIYHNNSRVENAA